jgi:ATP-dependent Lhr-like helicase
MTSPRSGSDPPPPSTSFLRLHEGVRRWIWERQWDSLHDVQEAAISAILDRRGDVIISAATASGKTEAAFLPICSELAEDARGSVRAIYVGPLKALINDQFARLEQLCEALDIPVHRWHGDVNATRKRAALNDPSGILLITPESLEALFVNHGTKLHRLFQRLDHVVIDELHAFIGAARGRQLQSQLHRLESLLDRRITRIGLSATLGDMSLAAEYLRPGHGSEVQVIVSAASGQELKIQVRGYLVHKPIAPAVDLDDAADEEPVDRPDEVAAHLYKVLRGGNHLVFANARVDVETLADRLRRDCERAHVPNEFHPHHGGLARELRHDVETRLKEGGAPLTVVCTSTLEMGIDIGSVQSVAQVGPPPSVAVLRQRLGRSGRRGEAAVLRAYIEEGVLEPTSLLSSELRVSLVETIAMVQLLVARWCEPSNDDALHLSTLVQQLLSTIAQYGGLGAPEAWSVLCDRGPFGRVDRRLFAEFLRSLAATDLIVQEPDGTLLLGVRGEKLVNHYSFYSAFVTPEEYRIVTGGRALGSMTTAPNERTTRFLIFAGRRWRVLSIDHDQRVIDVVPASAGNAKHTGGGGGWFDVHDRVRTEMMALYTERDEPVFIDAVARRFLGEGRQNFTRRALATERLILFGEDVVVLPWRGSRVVQTLGHLLAVRGCQVSADGFQVAIHKSQVETVRRCLADIASAPLPDAAEVVAELRAPPAEKFDGYLTESLRRTELRYRALDLPGAHAAAREIAGT